MKNPYLVDRPTTRANNNPNLMAWNKTELSILKKIYPRLDYTAEDVSKIIPWRSVNAIRLKASRLGLSKESLSEYKERCM